MRPLLLSLLCLLLSTAAASIQIHAIVTVLVAGIRPTEGGCALGSCGGGSCGLGCWSTCNSGTFGGACRAGSCDCNDCPAGKYGGNGNPCNSCPAGTWSNSKWGSCTKCAAGTWSDVIGATTSAVCSKCPAVRVLSRRLLNDLTAPNYVNSHCLHPA